ncbi:MAG: PASTA domain-containing protein, partial [candidate division NC10 bacterium]|nr:PASTA domain-containing protein [candidate division NC10 bacterium]
LCQVHSSQVPRNIIIAQSPPAGTKLHRGDPVNLLVSLGPFPRIYFMPDLRGGDGSSVSRALVAMGFKVQISFRVSPAQEVDRIVDQQPPGGSPIAQGQVILLVMGTEEQRPPSSLDL